MSTAAPAVLLAAAGVGLGHAVLPDHWVPLAVLGRTRRYPVSRIARLSALAGLGHVLLSLILGAVIVAIGLHFRSTVEHAQDAIIGGLLIATGLGFIVLERSGRGHHHDHDHEGHEHGAAHDHDHAGRAAPRGVLALMVPFGAAASPDLTILPVFLAATASGVATAIGSVVIFGAVTVGTFVVLTVAAARGGYQVQGAWLERWGNTITAGVLLVIGALVLAGVI